MSDYQLLIDLHKDGLRQGPGSDADTIKAIQLAAIDRSQPLKIADIGCGTGASTIILAKELNANIIAVDFLSDFLDILQTRANNNNVVDKIRTLNCSMDALPFTDNEFDIIWSEGAIYNIGFEEGVATWKQFLKPKGKIILSEITWLTDKRPKELETYWDNAYPQIATASEKISILERLGFCPEGYFYLPKDCWIDTYYRPLQKRFESFLEKYHHSDQAKAVVEAEQEEIALYEKYNEYYSYGFYIAQKL